MFQENKARQIFRKTKWSFFGKFGVLCFLVTPVLSVCSYHVTYAFQSESTLYSCLNVKELLARSRREIWNLSDCNWTRTHNHLVHKRTLNHIAKLAKLASLAKWLSVRLWTKWLWVRVKLQSPVLRFALLPYYHFLLPNQKLCANVTIFKFELVWEGFLLDSLSPTLPAILRHISNYLHMYVHLVVAPKAF